MKRLLLVASCIALSACSTYGPVPGSSLGHDAAPVSGFYGGGYSTYYSNSVRLRGSIISPYSGYDPYYFGSGLTTSFGYSPHYYRNHGFGQYGSGTLGHGLGHGVRHRRRH